MEAARSALKGVLPPPAQRRLRRAVDSVKLRGGRRFVDPVRNRLPLVPEEALRSTFRSALQLLLADEQARPLGDYVEFGVCHGHSMACMAEAAASLDLDPRLIGFDSFEGLPPGVEVDDGGGWYRGQFRSSERSARRRLRRRGVRLDRVHLVKGWFSETATPSTARRLGLERVSVAMIDCDAYSSTVPALEFLAPLLARRCVLLFDDWHTGGLAERHLGERRAFDEWMQSDPELEVVARLPSYSSNAEVLVLDTGRGT